MHDALYAEQLGYYAAGAVRFDARGDFITAPTLGKAFAHCLARQCAEVLHALGGGDVLEFGAGDASLAIDLLTALHQLDRLPARYWIIEPADSLIDRQQNALHETAAHLGVCIEWRKHPPPDLRGVMIANEVLDAIPAMRFEIHTDGVAHELGVGAHDHGFDWSLGAPLTEELRAHLGDIELPPGNRGEINPRAEQWIGDAANALQAGALLVIDYGHAQRAFYRAERRDGTLMCHYRHRAHPDPFFYPGLQDISTHVNFSRIGRAARAAGLTIGGYASQGAFLLSLGALDWLTHQQSPDSRHAVQCAQQIKTLTLPDAMGELVKVLALCRDYDQPLSGFTLAERSATL